MQEIHTIALPEMISIDNNRSTQPSLTLEFDREELFKSIERRDPTEKITLLITASAEGTAIASVIVVVDDESIALQKWHVWDKD